MPDVDGIELYGKLREIDSKFKVCFISTFVAGEYEKIRQKPATMTRLVQIVKSQLNMPQR